MKKIKSKVVTKKEKLNKAKNINRKSANTKRNNKTFE
jgi:hypothetical protein